MGQTLGIDRDLARKIKRMSRKELDGYLTRVTDKSYNNGYEQGLVEGIALAGQARRDQKGSRYIYRKSAGAGSRERPGRREGRKCLKQSILPGLL